MTKEKLKSLINYKTQMQDRLTGTIPEKHKDHPKTYHEFLRNEIKKIEITINTAKEVGVK